METKTFEELSEEISQANTEAMARLDEIGRQLVEIQKQLDAMKIPQPPGWGRQVERRNGAARHDVGSDGR